MAQMPRDNWQRYLQAEKFTFNLLTIECNLIANIAKQSQWMSAGIYMDNMAKLKMA